jgi:hypothetical protein
MNPTNQLICTNCGGPIVFTASDDKLTMTTTISTDPDGGMDIVDQKVWCPRCLKEFDERLGFTE